MRIGVGSYVQETNTFSPFTTKSDDFDWMSGDEIIERSKGTNTELAGFCDVLSEAGHEVVPLIRGPRPNNLRANRGQRICAGYIPLC